MVGCLACPIRIECFYMKYTPKVRAERHRWRVKKQTVEKQDGERPALKDAQTATVMSRYRVQGN